jgi:hypothetical protein
MKRQPGAAHRGSRGAGYRFLAFAGFVQWSGIITSIARFSTLRVATAGAAGRPTEKWQRAEIDDQFQRVDSLAPIGRYFWHTVY